MTMNDVGIQNFFVAYEKKNLASEKVDEGHYQKAMDYPFIRIDFPIY